MSPLDVCLRYMMLGCVVVILMLADGHVAARADAAREAIERRY